MRGHVDKWCAVIAQMYCRCKLIGAGLSNQFISGVWQLAVKTCWSPVGLLMIMSSYLTGRQSSSCTEWFLRHLGIMAALPAG